MTTMLRNEMIRSTKGKLGMISLHFFSRRVRAACSQASSIEDAKLHNTADIKSVFVYVSKISSRRGFLGSLCRNRNAYVSAV